MFYFDPMYFLIVGPGMLLAMWAAFKVKSTFSKYSDVPTRSGVSGADVARRLIGLSSKNNVRVEMVEGHLSDHYDPRSQVVRLSPDVYHGRSISALGVAAHECGHVLQDAQGYAPMRIRQNLVGPANFGSTFSFILIMAGMFLNAAGLIWTGILAFSAVVLFQLVTLPVEFNASTRAKRALSDLGIVTAEEGQGVAKVLNAAALTYVAALITSVLTLLYYILRVTGGGRSDD